MRPAPRAPSRRKLRILLTALALGQAVIGWRMPASAEVPPGALQACASIAEDAARLACYDRLAGRAAGKAAPAAPASTGGATRSPSLPAAAANGVPAAAAPPPAAASAAGASAAPPAAAAAPLPKESFGSYAAEHPTPPAAKSLEAAVVALGRSASGRMTVQLEGGALWELDEPDPLLAVGELVTITRASLGSYLMQTPSRRTHRVRRLR